MFYYMNNTEFLLLRKLNTYNFSHLNQRQIAESMSISLGLVNKLINNLKLEGMITESLIVTEKGKDFLNCTKPKNAVILAAGYGLRMIPINQNKPKALLSVEGKPLIERQIEHLLQVGITDITIVVGFMKEAFEYLINKYNVNLVYNKDYSSKNNLYSAACVLDKISNTYIVPCDLYCIKNPFNLYENFSWYMVNEIIDDYSFVRVNSNNMLNYNKNISSGNTMVGISFISDKDSDKLVHAINSLCKNKLNDHEFWEKALFEKSDIEVVANVVKSSDVIEINSYEQLRELDLYSKELQNESISVICDVFSCKNEDITNIKTLKKGMTNRSYVFTVNERKYIMRIPGEGTDQLINRSEEANVYNAIKDKNICDTLFYINPNNGMKISAFVENSRCCDPYDVNDLEKSMKKLREFHSYKLKVDHRFDIFEKIDFYESLWEENSIFIDYENTKKQIYELKAFVDSVEKDICLTHIDAVPDNFLFSYAENSKEEIQLIDWEYAAMQDPHVDIAMFCIYSMYKEKKYIDQLIDIYFQKKCSFTDRVKIYCYIAMCGLLWSNWCEYKRQLGVEFGEYSLMQYRYAKDYYRYAVEGINQIGVEG